MAQKAIVGEKVGMTQVWSDDQRVVPVTVLRIGQQRVARRAHVGFAANVICESA